MNSLAVIICTWNRAASLETTLHSLMKQVVRAKHEVEVVVVDNNSNDGTRQTVERLAEAWTVGRLRYVFEGRQGKQFALNTGIASSSADILAFTDDDILFPAGWIEGIFNTFEDGRADLVGGKTLLSWPESGIPPWYSNSMAAILGGVDVGDQLLMSPPSGYSPAGANLIATRTLFDRVGHYSEIHYRHMDYEFGMRCANAGVRVVYDPGLVVMAPVDPKMLSKRYFRRWSFKAGISRDDERVEKLPILFGVPRYLFRQLAQDLVVYPFECLFKSPQQTFARELNIWRAVGTIAARWYERLWPEQYPGWVEHFSQKKKNLY